MSGFIHGWIHLWVTVESPASLFRSYFFCQSADNSSSFPKLQSGAHPHKMIIRFLLEIGPTAHGIHRSARVLTLGVGLLTRELLARRI